MTNTKVNQSCWSCFHFQRYEKDPTKKNIGECRKMPQGGKRIEARPHVKDGNGGYYFQILDHWPFIGNGEDFWCSEWKKTKLPIPDGPKDPFKISWPQDWYGWIEWNVKKDLNISCWNCNHFQRNEETDPNTDLGECRKTTVPPVTFIDTTDRSATLRGLKFEIHGTVSWCGAWEITNLPIPDPPPPSQPTSYRKAWLAKQNPELFDDVFKNDPDDKEPVTKAKKKK